MSTYVIHRVGCFTLIEHFAWYMIVNNKGKSMKNDREQKKKKKSDNKSIEMIEFYISKYTIVVIAIFID